MEPNQGEGILEYMSRVIPIMVMTGLNETDATARAAGLFRAFSFKPDALFLQEEVTKQARLIMDEDRAHDEGYRAYLNFMVSRSNEFEEGLAMAKEAVEAAKEEATT